MRGHIHTHTHTHTYTHTLRRDHQRPHAHGVRFCTCLSSGLSSEGSDRPISRAISGACPMSFFLLLLAVASLNPISSSTSAIVFPSPASDTDSSVADIFLLLRPSNTSSTPFASACPAAPASHSPTPPASVSPNWVNPPAPAPSLLAPVPASSSAPIPKAASAGFRRACGMAVCVCVCARARGRAGRRASQCGARSQWRSHARAGAHVLAKYAFAHKGVSARV